MTADDERPRRTLKGRLDTSSSWFYLGLAFLPVGLALQLDTDSAAGVVFLVLGAVFLSQAWVRPSR